MKIKIKRQKKRKSTQEPKPLRTNWLDDDVYQSITKEFSYSAMYHRYIVLQNKTGKILYEFSNKTKADNYANGRDCTVIEIELTEDEAHEQRQRDLASKRWDSGYGA